MSELTSSLPLTPNLSETLIQNAYGGNGRCCDSPQFSASPPPLRPQGLQAHAWITRWSLTTWRDTPPLIYLFIFLLKVYGSA